MPYIGQEPVAGNFVLLDAITTSATATYALTKNSVAYSPESSRNMIVSLNGVTQAPETAYTVSGSNITFSSALTASDVIDYILVLGDVLDIGRPSDGVVGTDQMNYPLGNFSSTGIDDNATSTAITIDSSQRVGIGTSSPFGELSIKSTSPQVYLETLANGNVQINFNETADQLDVMVNNSNGKIAFGTNSTERMRIDSSGNVTIDGSDASTSLASTAILNLKAGDANNEYSILRFATSADGSIAYIGAKATTTGAYPSSVGNLEFGVQNGASTVTAMTIGSSGNVGIGETSPVAHLSVNAGGSPDATYGIANFAASAGNNSYVTVSRGANDQGGIKILRGSVADLSIHVNAAESSIINYNGGDTNDGLFFRSGSAETDVMALSSSGYVGIGTTSPSRLLTLSNTGATLLSLVSTNDDNCQLLFGDSASDTVGKIVYRHSDDSMAFEVNVAEAMRLDSSGNLLVGKTSTAFGTAGVEASAGSGLWSTRSGLPPLALNRLSTDGSIADFYKDGAIVGSIKCRSSGGNLEIDTVQSGIDFAGDGWLPMRNGSIVDNDLDIGSSSFRFDDIYATNGTIQTSDVNEKQDIEALSEAETRVAVAAKGLLRKFRWRSAVEEKGDEARIHFGIIAQDLQAAFEAEGLDAGDYAMFIHSTWTDEETGEERSRMGVRYSELLAFIIAAI